MPDIVAARPTTGAPVETAWGQQVHDALEGIIATPLDPFVSIAEGVATSAPVAFTDTPIAGLAPSTKPRWAEVYLSITHSGTAAVSVEVRHAGANSMAFNAGSTGVASRYGAAVGLVRLGGANNDTLRWGVPAASATTTYYVRAVAILAGV